MRPLESIWLQALSDDPTYDGQLRRERVGQISPSGKEAIDLAFDDAVAFTGCGFQTGTIEDDDPAAAVADQPCPLQGTRRLIGAAAIDSEHLRQEFLSGLYFIGFRAVLRRQEPATKTLLYGVKSVAGARPGTRARSWCAGSAGSTCEAVTALIKLLSKHIGLHPPGRPGSLYDDLVRKPVRPQN